MILFTSGGGHLRGGKAINSGQANVLAYKLDLIREAILVEKPSGARANRPFLTASAIGLAGKGVAHETKTEMAGPGSCHPGSGAGHGIFLVAPRQDYR